METHLIKKIAQGEPWTEDTVRTMFLSADAVKGRASEAYKAIANAHNASIGAAHASEPLPTGDIVDFLRERDDPLSQWAADVITHLRNNSRAAHAKLAGKLVQENQREARSLGLIQYT